jgi:hypothetical protein
MVRVEARRVGLEVRVKMSKNWMPGFGKFW